MTDYEITKTVRAIWRKACAEVRALMKTQKVKIFDSGYSFHRYVKHGYADGLLTSGEDMLRQFVTGQKTNSKDSFVIATPAKIKAEKKKCLETEISRCRKDIEYAKECIIKGEEKLRELLKKGT